MVRATSGSGRVSTRGQMRMDNHADLQIRKATEDDIESLCQLYPQLIPDAQLDPEAMRLSLQKMTQDQCGARVFVAVKNGVVVGTYQIVVFENLVRAPHRRGVIESMVVDAQYREQGIGQAMIEQAIRDLLEMQCAKINLVAGHERHIGHRLYRRVGFEHYGKGFVLTNPPQAPSGSD